MMSPLLLHQVVDLAHCERLATPRVGRSVMARITTNVHRIAWRSASRPAAEPAPALPAWLARLSDCVDEPPRGRGRVTAEPHHTDPAREECARP